MYHNKTTKVTTSLAMMLSENNEMNIINKISLKTTMKNLTWKRVCRINVKINTYISQPFAALGKINSWA